MQDLGRRNRKESKGIVSRELTAPVLCVYSFVICKREERRTNLLVDDALKAEIESVLRIPIKYWYF